MPSLPRALVSPTVPQLNFLTVEATSGKLGKAALQP